MATAKQLYTARNAGLKLAKVVQPYAQSDILLANETATAARAEVKAAADAAIVAATAIGGSAAPLPATQAIVTDAGTAPVKNSAGVAVPGTSTYTVAANAVTGVNLPATVAPVANAATVVVQNSAGTVVAGTHAATVAAGALSNVKLAATIATVANGVKVNATSVTGTGNFATFTVANGVITAIVLSAS